MVNYEFTFRGQADHAGTTPMKDRKDALYAATKAIDYLHTEFDKLDSSLVYTTGKISAFPNIHTIIPEEVKFTLDSRHQNPSVINQVVSIIENIPRTLCKCSVSFEKMWARNTVFFNENMRSIVYDVANELGYSNHKMYSGAGHDAQYIADIIPTTMIFVPSDKGDRKSVV